MADIFIHSRFKLNNHCFSSYKALLDYVSVHLPEHSPFLLALFDENNYIVAQTSGSTGTPKKIKILKQHLYNSARQTINFFDLKPETTALLNLSSSFIAGKMMWVRALIGGWHLDVISPKNEAIHKQLSLHKYDFGAMIPLQVFQNIDNIHQINKLIVGGGQASTQLLEMIENIDSKIYATYGMTETVTHIAVKPLNTKARIGFYQNTQQKNAYKLLSDIRISLDHRSCLIIDAPQLSNNPVITNDLVEIIDDQHFNWQGRYDNIINTGGIKVIPEQIEKKLSGLINERLFITSLPDVKLGNKIVLIVEGKERNISFDHLDSYSKPKNVYFVNHFKTTETGKIMRKDTLKMALKLHR